MTHQRRVSYALTPDGFHIAYAVSGEGDLCHVFLPELAATHVDEVEALHPAHVRFQRWAGSLSRFVFLDPRGIGISDAVPPDQVLRLDEWTADILAVLDALEVDRAVITGEGCSGHAAIQFAVTHPRRTLRLILSNSYARLTPAEDYAIGTSMAQLDDLAAVVERDWGTGRPTALAAPALVTDPSFLELFAGRERRTASPRTAAAIVRRMASSDIRELLPRVSVPTLVYYTGDIAYISVEQSRYLAEHIPDAILVEAPGHSFYLPDETDRLSAWAEFVVGGPAALALEKQLLTVLFTDVVGSTEQASAAGDARWAQILEDMDAYVAREVERHGGRLVKQTGDGHLAVFDAPGQALRAGCEIARGVHVFGVEVRCGLHVGEVELRPDGDIGGIAVHTAARVCDVAGPREVVVSRTVADLVAGSGFRFEDRGSHELRGVPGAWQLYGVVSRR